METDAYIALGSNLGDRELNLLRAVGEIGRLQGCRVTALSPFYETSPVGMSNDTPAFYNAVARVATTLSPAELLSELQRIEKVIFARTTSAKPESRRMDLDILIYEGVRMEEPDLTLPHPRMSQRRFVLEPLAAIAPDLLDPSTGRRISELLASLQSEERVIPLEG